MTPEFRDRAVYLPDADALVCADLHVGRDTASNVELPLGERRDLPGRIDALIEGFQPAEVVVAGDCLHAFDRVEEGVARTFAAIRDRVEAAGAALVVTPGNHDTLLGTVFDGETPAEYAIGDGTVVCHGHEEPEREADRYVVGHDHPTIEIEGQRRYCYLYGEGVYEGADVLVLPAFNRLAPGVTVNGMGTRDFQTPLVRDAAALRPIVRDPDADETLSFPPLGELRRLL